MKQGQKFPAKSDNFGPPPPHPPPGWDGTFRKKDKRMKLEVKCWGLRGLGRVWVCIMACA